MGSSTTLAVERLSALLELIPFPACITAVPSTQVLRANRAFIERCPAAGTGPLLDVLQAASGEAGDSDGLLVAALREGRPVQDVDAMLAGVDGRLPVAVSIQPLSTAGDNSALLVLCYPTTRWIEDARQYRALVEGANEGIWRLDHDGRITFANRRMAELLGVPMEAVVGRYKWDFVFDEDVPEMKALFERRRQGAALERADIRFRRRDGREVWTLMSARPIHREDGRFAGAIDLFTDITERRRAEEALRESDRRKDEFMAVLGHELRGPLAPILTAVKLLQVKGPKDPALERLRDTILRQTMQLSILVDDLVDVGRIAAGKLQLDMAPIDVRDALAQGVEVSSDLVQRRRHTLTQHVPEDPVHVEGDMARLIQVVSNLLNNAAKYTPEGGSIDVVLRRDEGDAVIVVRDNGVGIPPEMLDRIFDRFVQVGSARAGAEGGLGIGLSVVRAIVELHGGRVEVKSGGIGQGSEFAVRVPLKA